MKVSIAVKNDFSGSTITFTIGPLEAHAHIHGDVDDRPVVSGGFHYQAIKQEVDVKP